MPQEELDVICEFEEERDRIGHFVALFPTAASWEQYHALFPDTMHRDYNRLLAQWLQLPRRYARAQILRFIKNQQW